MIAVLLGWVILGERINLLEVLGAATVVGCVALTVRETTTAG